MILLQMAHANSTPQTIYLAGNTQHHSPNLLQWWRLIGDHPHPIVRPLLGSPGCFYSIIVPLFITVFVSKNPLDLLCDLIVNQEVYINTYVGSVSGCSREVIEMLN